MTYTSSYNTSGAGEAAIIGFIFLATALFFLLIVLLYSVPLMVTMWRLAEKAGKPGWTQIVPYYNLFVQNEIAGTPSYYPIVATICSVAAVLPFVGVFTPVVGTVFSILILVGMLQRFTLTSGQIALIILLPIVAVFSLKDVAYRGPAPQPVHPQQPYPPAHVPPAPVSTPPTPVAPASSKSNSPKKKSSEM